MKKLFLLLLAALMLLGACAPATAPTQTPSETPSPTPIEPPGGTDPTTAKKTKAPGEYDADDLARFCRGYVEETVLKLYGEDRILDYVKTLAEPYDDFETLYGCGGENTFMKITGKTAEFYYGSNTEHADGVDTVKNTLRATFQKESGVSFPYYFPVFEQRLTTFGLSALPLQIDEEQRDGKLHCMLYFAHEAIIYEYQKDDEKQTFVRLIFALDGDGSTKTFSFVRTTVRTSPASDPADQTYKITLKTDMPDGWVHLSADRARAGETVTVGIERCTDTNYAVYFNGKEATQDPALSTNDVICFTFVMPAEDVIVVPDEWGVDYLLDLNDHIYLEKELVCSNTRWAASMRFKEFSGRKILELETCDNSTINVRATLESGSLSVSYAVYGKRENSLCSLQAGEQISLEVGAFAKDGSTVLIFIESNGKCENGDLRLTIVDTETHLPIYEARSSYMTFESLEYLGSVMQLYEPSPSFLADPRYTDREKEIMRTIQKNKGNNNFFLFVPRFTDERYIVDEKVKLIYDSDVPKELIGERWLGFATGYTVSDGQYTYEVDLYADNYKYAHHPEFVDRCYSIAVYDTPDSIILALGSGVYDVFINKRSDYLRIISDAPVESVIELVEAFRWEWYFYDDPWEIPGL